MKESSEPVADLVGAITANVYMLLIIAVFVARILGLPEISRWIGITSSLVIFPLLYLFVPNPSIKGFNVTILPGIAPINKESFHPYPA